MSIEKFLSDLKAWMNIGLVFKQTFQNDLSKSPKWKS